MMLKSWNLLLLLGVAVLSAPVLASGTNETAVYDRTCFGCVTAGYKYCASSPPACILTNETCSSAYYTESTGCPVSDHCHFGMNGHVFVSSKEQEDRDDEMESNRTNSSRSVTPVVGPSGSAKLSVPADKPCVLGFVNHESQEIDVTFSNSNVSAYLFTL